MARPKLSTPPSELPADVQAYLADLRREAAKHRTESRRYKLALDAIRATLAATTQETKTR